MTHRHARARPAAAARGGGLQTLADAGAEPGRLHEGVLSFSLTAFYLYGESL